MARERFIHITESEWNGFYIAIARELWAWAEKGYGYKFVSNETGEPVSCLEELIGALSIPLSRALEGEPSTEG